MSMLRVNDVATLVGMSPDTVRRWVDTGRLPAERDGQGRRLVASADLAAFLREGATEDPALRSSSARNRFRGIVTNVVRDAVMAQVEVQAGPHRVVSLMSRESLDDLSLEVGSIVTAIVKSTNVIMETDPSTGARHA
ncbi:helix-turn-helix transcriptional regulator [Spiractinospora alimapuensis]|nr:TOBE domain-containing protein [Spiractinospora alimapuensis]QVQ54484.1 helix-turn-helix transcriptional regulator [Spiractinospora alimapuensis]